MSLLEPEAPAVDQWIFRGETGPSGLVTGSCAGGGAETVIPWVFPEDGVYMFTTVDGAEFDTALHARSQCLAPATELACNDDSIGLRSTMYISADAGSQVYLFVDAFGDGQNSPFTLRVFRADENGAPVVTRAEANRTPDGEIAVVIEGADENADARYFITELAHEDGLIEGSSHTQRGEIFGQTVFGEAYRLPARGVADQATHVRISISDYAGNVAEQISIEIGEQAEVQVGEPCDPNEVENRCVEGSFCQPSGANQETLCAAPTPPSITGGQAWRNGDTLSLLIQGRDETRDVLSAQVFAVGVDGELTGVSQLLPPTNSVEGLDEFELLLTTTHLAAPEEDEVEVVLLDSQGLNSPPRRVSIEPIPIVDADGPCDGRGLLNICEDGHACLADGDGHRCIRVFAPTIEIAVVSKNLDLNTLGVRVSGREPDADISHFDLELSGDDGAVLGRLLGRPFTDVSYGMDGAYQARWSGRLNGALDLATQARLVVVDALNQESPQSEVALVAPAQAQAGAPCDPFWAIDRCPEGTGCFDRAGFGDNRCVNVQAPVVESTSVWYNPDTGGLGLRLRGSDADSDVIGFEIEIFDAAGDPLLTPMGGTPARLQFQELVQFAGTFTGTLSIPYETLLSFFDVGDPFPLPAQVSVGALDAALLSSEPQVVVPGPPPVIAERAVCDPIGGLNRCDDGAFCIDDNTLDGNPSQCVAFLRACPDNWPVADFNDLAVDGVWRIEGDAELAGPGTNASCRQNLMPQVYRFTAPLAGQYAFTTEGIGDTPLQGATIFLRQACLFEHTETTCTSGFRPTTTAIAQLEADETIYVFVSRTFEWMGGQYALSVDAHESPTLGVVEAWINRETGSMEVTGLGRLGSRPINRLALELRDADGQAVPLNGVAYPWVVPAELEAPGDGQIQFTATARFQLPAQEDAGLLERVTTVRVTAWDDVGSASDPVEEFVQSSILVAVGDACDRLGARARCPEGLFCISEPPAGDAPANDDLRCTEVQTNCPADWTVTNLNEGVGAEGPWVHANDLGREAPPLETHGGGTCSGSETGDNDAFSFTAPAAGTYVFQTSGEEGDTIMFLRSACGREEPEFELACNDDDGTLFSRFEVDLVEGQTVYAFVDSFGVAGRSEYLLRINQL